MSFYGHGNPDMVVEGSVVEPPEPTFDLELTREAKGIPPIPLRTWEIARMAQAYYNPRLPYHNWNHALEVMADADDLLYNRMGGKQGDAPATRISRHLTLIAAAWHDSFHDRKVPREFRSKEQYQAHIARTALTGILTGPELDEVEIAIQGTEIGARPASEMATVLHFADIANMAASYDDFFEHSKLLWMERGMPDWDRFKQGSETIINQEISVSSSRYGISRLVATHYDPNYFWSRASENLQRFMAEEQPEV